MDEFCFKCAHDNYPDGDPSTWCEIIALSMAYEIKDIEYPQQWVFDKDGYPCCTKFEHEETT